MAMGAASIGLLTMMVSLLLVAAAGNSVVSGGTTTIRLPSDDARGGVAADLVRAMARAKLVAGDEKRPWECCDLAICTRTYPPICRCLDEVDQCSDACNDCVETEGSRHVCTDEYWGDPGPMCHEHGNGRRGGDGFADDDDARQAAPATVEADDKKVGNDDGKRPWECCDLGICSMSIPPICRCLDKVDRCSDACKECEETEDSRHVCLDTYHGDPGPKCHDNGNGRGGLADAGKAAAVPAAVMADDRKTNAGGGGDGEEKRPWECCDVPICTRSWPPVCLCGDTVERCASTCEHCEPVEGSGYRCLDPHQGDPGPSCGGDHDWSRRLGLARGRHF